MRIGFDIGGTFTDVIALTDDGHLTTAKLLSLTGRIGESISTFIEDLKAREPVEHFIHATTIASNAVIERKTAPTGLLCTKGFRDDLEMRGQRRPNIYDFNWDRLPPLINRALRLEVDERVLGNGTVACPLDVAAAERVIRQIVAQKVEVIAICLVNAYLNPVHERQLRDVIARIAPMTVCCLSSDIDPEIGEYERASTTTINASLIPIFDRYLQRLEECLAVYSTQFLIMQSNGGILSAKAARVKPANLIESGPAAGVLAAARLAREFSLDKVLSFDMGGTTAKACLIENGTPFEKTSGEVGGGATAASRLFGGNGHILRVPWLDIVEVGAGGGSIAWVDNGALLRVGPQSAGADPGPVCYGRGGVQPTLTDANVVLGYINPQSIAGATIAIDRDAAWAGIEKKLAGPLGLSVPEAAYGVTRVANATMMRALRAVSTERGRDAREFTLIAFGGGGPLHAAALAETMDIRRICVPIYPGLFSALGLLLADFSREYVRSVALRLDATEPEPLFNLFDDMERQAARELGTEKTRGAILFKRQVTVKYNFQVSAITLTIPSDLSSADFHSTVAALFAEAHRANFGHTANDAVELVSLRLRATKKASEVRFSELSHELRADSLPSEISERSAYFGADHGSMKTKVSSRREVKSRIDGPLIIEEPDTTIVVPPGWSVSKDEHENLLLER